MTWAIILGTSIVGVITFWVVMKAIGAVLNWLVPDDELINREIDHLYLKSVTARRHAEEAASEAERRKLMAISDDFSHRARQLRIKHFG